MKKVKGIALLMLGSMLVLAAPSSLISYLSGNMLGDNALASFLSTFFIGGGMGAFFLYSGWKTLKKPSSPIKKGGIDLSSYKEEFKVQFTCTVSEEEYVSISKNLTFTRILIYTGIVTIFMAVAAVSYFIKQQDIFMAVAVGAIFLFILIRVPMSLMSTIKKNYYKNERITKPIHYELDTIGIKASGDSFTGWIKWQEIQKVIEVKDFLLIYDTQYTAYFINKKQVPEKDYQTIVNFLNQIGFAIEYP